MDVIEGKCKLCGNEDALIPESKQIIIDLKEAFYNKINETQDVTNMNVCLKCVVKIQFAYTFSKDCKKEHDSTQTGKECLVCAETKCILINTNSNPSNFENNMKSFENFAGIQLNSDASVVCLICVHNLTTWVEAKTMLENINLIENDVEMIENIAEVEENENASENAVELIENSAELEGNKDTPEKAVEMSENIAEVEETEGVSENAVAVIEHIAEVEGNEDTPKKPEESLASEVINDQDIVKPQISEKEEITHSKWSTYIRNITRKFVPVRKMNINVKDIDDDTILNKIPYVNVTVETQIVSISEKNDPIVITDDSSNEKPFKLSKLVQPSDQKKVTYKNLCDVCDKSFETRCEYLSHKLSHEKFEKLVINVLRTNFATYKFPSKKQHYAPSESLDKLLTKWLGTPAAISSVMNTTETISPVTVTQQSSNPGILSLKKRVLGEDFDLMSDDDEFGPNKSNNTSTEFSKLLTDKIIVSDESKPEKDHKETNGSEETVSVKNKLSLTTSDNSSQSELESLRIEDTDEEHAIDSKTSKNEENSRKRKLSDVDEASNDESPKKRAKVAHGEEDTHHDEDEEMDTQPDEEQSSQNTNEETEKTEFLKLSKLQRRESISNTDAPLVERDEEKDGKSTITLSSDEDITVSQEGDENRTKTVEKRKRIKSNKLMNSSDEDDASETRGESEKKIVEEECKTKKQKRKTKKADNSSDGDASESQEGAENRTETVEKRKRKKANKSMNSSDEDDASETRGESEKKIAEEECKTKKQKRNTKKADNSSAEDASESQESDENRTEIVEKRKRIKSTKSMNSSNDDDDVSETRDGSEQKIMESNSKIKKQNTKKGDDNRHKTNEKCKKIKSTELMISSDEDDASETCDESEKKILGGKPKTKKQQKTKKGDVSSEEDASKSKADKDNTSVAKKQTRKSESIKISSDEDASESQGGDDDTKTVENRKRIKSNELIRSCDEDDASETRNVSEKTVIEDISKTKKQKRKTRKADVSSDEDASESPAVDDNSAVEKKQKSMSESIEISSDEDGSGPQGRDDNKTKKVEKSKKIKSSKSMNSSDEDVSSQETGKSARKNANEGRSKMQNDDDDAEANAISEKSSPVKSSAQSESQEEEDLPNKNEDDNQNDKEISDHSSSSKDALEAGDNDESQKDNEEDDNCPSDSKETDNNINEAASKHSDDEKDGEISSKISKVKKGRNTMAMDVSIMLSDDEEVNRDDQESERDNEEKSVIETENNTALATPPKTGQQVTARSSSGKKSKGHRRKPVTLELVDDNSLKKSVESKPKDQEDTIPLILPSHSSPEIILELSDPECFDDIEKNLISSDSNSKSPILLDEEYYNKTMKEGKKEVARQSPVMTSTNNEEVDISKSSNLFDEPLFKDQMSKGKKVVSRQSPIMTCEELLNILDNDNPKDIASGKKRARTSSMTDASQPTKKIC